MNETKERRKEIKKERKIERNNERKKRKCGKISREVMRNMNISRGEKMGREEM